ncbi:Phage repressor [Liberibacter crescens BT-1]|uniref:Phage repressor n=1 Tax=Liberibacter crescens (strain BT-1) TaxID=1215343 RepID=L0ETZ3_LIBCB|nr:helix-turn-helix transcriptional regulator [Liberibacter crescens]AGA64118.1 Phage repressor [Liberibacter crescens BT-1]AMC13290.1 DNA-binding protein [Liberibacter crescens]
MSTFSHEKIWKAIDQIAKRHNLTPSGLARKAGLDPTSFNKSKRLGPEGRNRWPSTESIAKVLEATGESIYQFLEWDLSEEQLLKESKDNDFQKLKTIPLLNFPQKSSGGFFDNGGFPTGDQWSSVEFPDISCPHNGIYAIQIQDDSMLPLYRNGDTLILNAAAQVNSGDRILIKPKEGDVSAKILINRNERSVDLIPLNSFNPIHTINMKDIEWIARIVWASQ